MLYINNVQSYTILSFNKSGVDAGGDVFFLASLYMEYCKNGGDGTALSFKIKVET